MTKSWQNAADLLTLHLKTTTLMNQLYRFALSMALSAMCAVSAYAIPARGHQMLMPVAGGCDSILVTQKGDETFHYYTDAAGARYTLDAAGCLVPMSEDAWASRRNINERSRVRARVGSRTSFPTTGSPRVLVILAQFSDRAFTHSADQFERMMNERGYADGGATGSVADYFADNSCGVFTPQFDVYGPVTLPGTRAYYGSNDQYGNDANAYRMLIDACTALDDQIDFTRYDADGDGVADIVYIYYAGYGENDGGGSNSVWPHTSTLSSHGATLTLDGIAINPYSCSNELQNGIGTTISGIGTFCHEFTHVLGFPDIYATNGEDIPTPLFWTLMDRGSYNNNGRTPAAMTAYERSFMGWLTPTEAAGDASVLLPSIEGYNRAYRISTANPDEYFLVEYRRRTGWDVDIPGQGMLVWHIDYNSYAWDTNSVNNDPNRQRIALVSADGRTDDYDRAAVAFRSAATLTASDFLKTYGSDHPDATLRLTGVTDRAATFTIGAGAAALPTMESPRLDAVRDHLATASWAAAEGASGYLVTVRDNRGRILPGLANVPVADTQYTIDGLEPLTCYTLAVAATAGASLGADSYEVPFTTTDPGLSYAKPEIPVVSATEATSFVLSWTEVPGAERYLIDVWTMVGADDASVTCGFDDALTLPEGWSTTATSTFRVNGYYGASAPSLVLANTGEYLQTPTLPTSPASLSFWCRGRNTGIAASVDVMILKNGEWVKAATVAVSTTAKTEIIDAATLAGATAIRLVRADATGTVMIDDVTVTYPSADVPEYHLSAHDAGNTTSMSVTGLKPQTKYMARVCAADAYDTSLPSEVAEVTTGDTDGIHAAEASETGYILAGRTIAISSASVTVTDLAGRTVASGTGTYVLAPGIYIVSGPETHSKKISIQ